MSEDRLPILIGAGMCVQKCAPEEALSPMELMARVSKEAAAETGKRDEVIKAIDTIAVVRMVVDSTDGGGLPKNLWPNPPRTVARSIGASPRSEIYSGVGGNMPQALANLVAERIANGETDMALIGGGEGLGSLIGRLQKGIDLGWGDEEDGTPEVIGPVTLGETEHEIAHHLNLPVNVYPLFENAIRGQKGQSVKEHQKALGELFAPFTKVAATHPSAWFPIERTPDEISTVSDDNRFVGFPYTKYMNAIIRLDQAAAFIMCSVGKARELGIDPSRWIYLHGCGDASDSLAILDRVNYYSSPAIRTIGKKAAEMAGFGPTDADFIDLYSCFPSAVEIACRELGIDEKAPQGLTLTGGLPYHGGPGNNYVSHSIATLYRRMCGKPGSKGLITANGGYITKHAIGLYSTEAPDEPWKREDPASYQREIDALDHPEVTLKPSGPAKIETYTVVHGRNGFEFGIVIGRLDEDGSRFASLTDRDPAVLNDLMARESLDRPGTVRSDGEVNIFAPA